MAVLARDLRRGAWAVLAFGLGAFGLSFVLPEPPASRLTLALSFWLLSAGPLLLALPGWRRAAAEAVSGPAARWLLVGGLLLATAPERFVRGSPTDLLRLGLYAAVPLLLTLDRSREDRYRFRDLLVVAALWLPVEFGAVRGHSYLVRLFGLNLLLLLYVVERPLFDLGRLVPVRRDEWTWGLLAYAVFLVPAIPIGYLTGFALPQVADYSPLIWIASPLIIFWITAYAEEAQFRGTIQELLQRATGRVGLALVLGSLIFGAAHLENDGFPNWRYALLATLAGAAYGTAYLKTGRLAAPMLTHMLVDFTWGGFFGASR